MLKLNIIIKRLVLLHVVCLDHVQMLFFTFGHIAETQITSVKFTYSVRIVTWLLRCRGREYAHVQKKHLKTSIE